MTYDEAYQDLLSKERAARKADADYGEASEESVDAYRIYARARQEWADLWRAHRTSKRKVTA